MGKKKEKKEEVQKTALDKLVELKIPRKNIELYLKIYNLIVSTLLHLEASPQKINNIIDDVSELSKSGWISAEAAIDIQDQLVKAIYLNPNKKQLKAFAYAELRRTGNPGDYALNFLIHALIYDIKYFAKTKKPYYSLVLDFLTEQKIGNGKNSVMGEDELRKRFKRANVTEIINNVYLTSIIAGYKIEIRNYPGFINSCFSADIGDNSFETGLNRT